MLQVMIRYDKSRKDKADKFFILIRPNSSLPWRRSAHYFKAQDATFMVGRIRHLSEQDEKYLYSQLNIEWEPEEKRRLNSTRRDQFAALIPGGKLGHFRILLRIGNNLEKFPEKLTIETYTYKKAEGWVTTLNRNAALFRRFYISRFVKPAKEVMKIN